MTNDELRARENQPSEEIGMSDTPRADKAISSLDFRVVADFSRQLERELSAAQAENVKLREALGVITCDDLETAWGNAAKRDVAREALSTPSDHSALNAMLEDVKEQAAKVINEMELTLPDTDYNSPSERHLIAVVEAGCRGAFTAAIRAMKVGVK